jgi:outer membrane protein TolC
MRFIVLALVGFLSISPANTQASLKEKALKLPPNAQKMLKGFPNEAVSLPMVLSLGMAFSDSFVLVQSGRMTQDTQYFQAKIPTDFNLSASFAQTNSKGAPFDFQTPYEKATGNKYSVGVGTYLSTGTELGLSFGNDYSDTTFSAATAATYGVSGAELNSTSFSLSLKQKLWNDFLGYATSRNIEAGIANRKAVILGVTEASEDWAIGMMDLFYGAWLSQAQVEAALANISRQQRLLKITRIKAKRGTAEKPDLLQMQAAETFALEQHSDSLQDLKDVWRGLVIGLKLPEEFLDINPTYVPILLDQPVSEAAALCGQANKLHPAPTKNTTLDKLENQFKAAKLSMEAAKNSLAPDVSLNASLSQKGVEKEFSDSLDDVSGGKYPSWEVGVSFAMPFSNYAAKAQLSGAAAQKVAIEAQLSQEKSKIKADWLNDCENLFRLKSQRDEYKKAFDMQSQRAQLEERRFRIGRIPAFNVIQADGDLTQAELALRASEVELRKSAWRVKRLKGKLALYLESLVKNPIQIK